MAELKRSSLRKAGRRGWHQFVEHRLSASSPQVTIPRVIVRTMGGAHCEVALSVGWTLRDLKQRVEEELHVPAAQQRLFHGCTALQDEDLNEAKLGRMLPAEAGADAPLELALVVRSPEVATMLQAVKWNVDALQSAPEELRGDREVVMEAVRCHGPAMQYATEELRGNKEVVMEAVRRDGRALEFAAGELQGDRDIVMEAVKQHGWALAFATKELQADEGVVKEAVRTDGQALLFAAGSLRQNRDVVLEAVRQDGCALQFASRMLQGDVYVVEEAVRQNDGALEFVSSQLQDEVDICRLLQL